MRLSKVSLNGEESPLSNIVVIIGPNNSGKTKLLENLKHELTHSYERSSQGDYVLVSQDGSFWRNLTSKDNFIYEMSELDSWLGLHEQWKLGESSPNRNKMMFRSKKHILQWGEGEAAALNEEELTSIRSNPGVKDSWLVKFKKSHIEYANIDNRFNASNTLDGIDASNKDNPSNLYIESKTINQLNKHIGKLFGKEFVLLKVSFTNYRLLLVDSKQKDRPKWANSNKIEADNRTIKQHNDYQTKYPEGAVGMQSHGTRAALSMLMALADDTRKVVFLDEPESHIYPAARKYIARRISEGSRDKQYFIVTHDVDFLEGVARSRKDFTVIKVNRKRETRVVDFNAAERRRTSSELKNSMALRAGFYDAAIFVEGPSDRYIYEAVLTRKKMIDDDIEYGVIDCHGNDKIADSVKFAYDIGTKIAVITDFDTILRTKKENNVDNVGLIDRILKTFPHKESLIDNINTVRSLLKGSVDSKKGLNAKSLSDEQKNQITELLEELKLIGIFVVPYGELYDWFSVSKNNLAVEDLRNRYFNKSSKYGELTNFVQGVAKFISSD